MIVLSWDVGIINLAYCLLSYENDKWKIIDWGNIDLLGKPGQMWMWCQTKVILSTNRIREKVLL